MFSTSPRAWISPALALVMATGVVNAADESAPAADGTYGDLLEALTEGKVDFKTRLRYEFVDQDGIDDNANGLIIDTTLGYRTGSFHGFTGYLQFESVHHILDDFNWPARANGDYPVIADPEVTEVNQVYLDYDIEDTGSMGRLGRQRIILDNSRHVGNVGWRANEQTFDAATFVSDGDVENLKVSASFLWVTNTIFGGNDHFDAAFLVNAGYKIEEFGTLTGYGYLLDYDEDLSTKTDLATFGVRFAGKHPITEDVTALYEAELASQNDYSDSEDISAMYLHLVAGASFMNITAKVGYELLGSDDGDYGFAFPLGTNHKFNGWADKFLGTPTSGLQDIYLNVAATFPETAPGLKVAAFYHKFDSDEDSIDFGDEFDAVATYKYDSHLSFGAKAAFYMEGDDDSGKTDTNKFWLWTEFGF